MAIPFPRPDHAARFVAWAADRRGLVPGPERDAFIANCLATLAGYAAGREVVSIRTDLHRGKPHPSIEGEFAYADGTSETYGLTLWPPGTPWEAA